MIERYKALPMAAERPVPEIGEETVFYVVREDTHPDSPPKVHELHIVISAVDPTWGPKHTRVEGFVVHDGDVHTVVGFYAHGQTSTDDYIGRLEIHFNES